MLMMKRIKRGPAAAQMNVRDWRVNTETIRTAIAEARNVNANSRLADDVFTFDFYLFDSEYGPH